ncbi:glutathione S-transferase [Irpex rosettiformis]|uniref:Glutathione S-transferase n=1 Tax=Irpex rosettiformis TaxID=378272 RepID=A0ACB8UD23_9APHY|nr:glutathione S-transferase [Irpex rosettiformis]
MVLKIHGVPKFAYTQIVLVVLKETNAPYELITVDWINKEHKTPAYLEKHPFGQYPYMDDDGFILHETSAIVKYIATKYRASGTALAPDPSNLKATVLFDQAWSVQASDFSPYAGGIVMERLGKPFHGSQPDEQAVQQHITNLENKLNGYEAILGKQSYLAGDNLTAADLAHLPLGTLIGELDVKSLEDPTRRPNVARWWNDISNRPAWKEVLSISDA